MSAKNIIFSGLINVMNIAFLVGQLNYQSLDVITTLNFYIFLAVFGYFVFIFINELKLKFCPFILGEEKKLSDFL